MGKYMRKVKILADVAVMEVSQSTLGVRTRAKTLALQQRLHSSTTPTPPTVSDSSCYLQLRSRRLEKPSLLRPPSQKPSSGHESEIKPSPMSSSRLGVCDSVKSGSSESGPITRKDVEEIERDFDLGLVASFGENNLDFEPRESRSAGESTPCIYIKDVELATPQSSTWQKAVNDYAVNQRTRSAVFENIPSAAEIEEFFTRAYLHQQQQQQQQEFIEKYNFDIVNDMPLPGRYEWARV